jgi:NADH-quinone oxidoreductase subunit C/D
MTNDTVLRQDLTWRFGDAIAAWQPVSDDVPTLWATKERAADVLRYLKTGIEKPYRMLYDLFAIDERMREHRLGQPQADFTIVYHLLSFDRNADIRVKVPLHGESLSVKSVTDIWPAANWYEREAWDMFGVHFDGHPGLRRILMPPW